MIYLTNNNKNTLYSWAITAEGVYILNLENNYYQVNYINFADKTIKPLAILPHAGILGSGSLTIIADKNKLLFTSSQTSQADIKKIDHPLLP